MKKCDVIKNSREFDEIINSRKYVKNNEFVIYYRNNTFKKNRFGISVGKKIGNAVTRNYYKRIIRNICDKYNFIYSNYKDYIIIMRKGCIELSFSDINNSFISLVKKIEKETCYEKTI